MKKQIIAGIALIACAALYAAVLPRSAEIGDLPAEPKKTAVSAEIEARSEKKPRILLSADTPAPDEKAVAKSVLPKTDITTEEKTESVQAEPATHTVSKFAPVSAEPKSGDSTVIDGKPHIWIPDFGWIVDEGGGSVGTTVGNPGDELTDNKVGIMGDGTTIHGKGNINKKIGIMGGGTVAENMYKNLQVRRCLCPPWQQRALVHPWTSQLACLTFYRPNVYAIPGTFGT